MTQRHFAVLLLLLLFIACIFTCNTFGEKQSIFLAHEAGLNEKTGKQRLVQEDNVVIEAQGKRVGEQIVYFDLNIFLFNKLVFADSVNMFTTERGLLPIVRQLKNDNKSHQEQQPYEILIGLLPQPDQSCILRLIADAQQQYQLDTLPFFLGNHFNADSDSFLEFMGFLSPIKPYCSECDSAFYNPLLFYEMRDTGFVLDSATTQKWAKQHYGNFYGFRPDSTRIVPIYKANELMIYDT